MVSMTSPSRPFQRIYLFLPLVEITPANPTDITLPRDTIPYPNTVSEASTMVAHSAASTDTIASTNTSVPWPGSTFIISARGSGKVISITLVDGNIALEVHGSKGSQHWECVQSNGWIGFKSPVSGKYLGYDGAGNLVARADKHHAWEHFCPRQHPQGGYVLFMRNWNDLWPVGMKSEEENKLARLKDSEIRWEFTRVEDFKTSGLG